MRSLTPASRLWLIVGDLAAIFLFVYIGREAHGLASAPDAWKRLALLTGAFWLPWLGAGWVAGAFALPAPGGLRDFLFRALLAWLIATPVAVLLRAVALGRADVPITFLAVVLGVGGAFVLAWRLAFWLTIRRRMA